MANVTLAVDDDVLRRARIRALEQGTSVNALIREYLESFGGAAPANDGIAAFLDLASRTCRSPTTPTPRLGSAAGRRD